MLQLWSIVNARCSFVGSSVVDLESSHPDVVAELTARIRAVNETTFSPDRGQRDPRGCSTALGRYGGIWGPFSQLTADSDTHA